MSKIEKLVEDLSSLTVLEAADLAKLLEEKWGVSAAAPVAAAAAPAAAAAAPAAEKTEFTVVLTDAGDKKINVIKEVRAITGLRAEGSQGPGRRRSQGSKGRRARRTKLPRSRSSSKMPAPRSS
jgi:ribosomal protein L7/L12